MQLLIINLLKLFKKKGINAIYDQVYFIYLKCFFLLAYRKDFYPLLWGEIKLIMKKKLQI